MQQTTISSLPLSIQTILHSKNITNLTPIQSEAIGYILDGQNIIAQAKTGSGKTMAFAIPLMMQIKPNNTHPKILVLAPTRELCLQIVGVFRLLARDIPNLKIAALIGGEPLRVQRKSIEQGVDIVVATPGRLIDHLFRESLSLNEIETVVLDEGDKMVDMGFFDDMTSILRHTKEKVQVLLFSATFPPKLEKLSQTFSRGAKSIKTDITHDEDKITIYGIKTSDLSSTLIEALWQYNPKKSILFCNTKDECDTICNTLQKNNISAEVLHGNLSQYERQEALLKLANGSTRLLVATDLASRGLDISDIDMVISFGLPQHKETLTHRIGRTARGDKNGVAILVYSQHQENYAKELLPQLEPINLLNTKQKAILSSMQTFRISGGRKDKISARDILGALTKDIQIPTTSIGKIDIQNDYSYVAISVGVAQKAYLGLKDGKIKGKKHRIDKI